MIKFNPISTSSPIRKILLPLAATFALSLPASALITKPDTFEKQKIEAPVPTDSGATTENKGEKTVAVTEPAELAKDADATSTKVSSISKTQSNKPCSTITKAQASLLYAGHDDYYNIDNIKNGSLDKTTLKNDYQHVIDIITSSRNVNNAYQTVSFNNNTSIEYDGEGRVKNVFDENGHLWIESDNNLYSLDSELDAMNVNVYSFSDPAFSNIPSCKFHYSQENNEMLSAEIYNINYQTNNKQDFTLKGITWNLTEERFTHESTCEYKDGLPRTETTWNYPVAKDSGIEHQYVWRKEFNYNKQNQPVNIYYYCDIDGQVDKDPRVETFQYDNNNRLIEHKDAFGSVTKYKYDKFGNLIEEADDYATTTYKYDSNKVKTESKRTSYGNIYDDLKVTYQDGKPVLIIEAGDRSFSYNENECEIEIYQRRTDINYDNGITNQKTSERTLEITIPNEDYDNLLEQQGLGNFYRGMWK